MASKRKRTVIMLEKKLQVIAEVRNGKSQRLIAETFGVPKSTVGDIWKEREKIEAHVTLVPAAIRRTQKALYCARSAILCETHTFRSSTTFFLSYGHCPVPWCPDKGGFTVQGQSNLT